MKLHDITAISAGTLAGVQQSTELESILTSGAAAIAVYLVKLALGWLARKTGASK